VKRESETEDEGIREDEKVLERVGYECGQPVRERGKIVCDKNAIVMVREKRRGENKRRNCEIAADCTQRQHEFFAEEAERVLVMIVPET